MSLRSEVLQGAPDPRDAEWRLDRIRESAAAAGVDLDELADDGRTVLSIACQRAPYLALLLARDPRRIFRVTQDPYLHREKPAEVFQRQLQKRLSRVGDDEDQLSLRLREFRADEMVRLGARELQLGTPLEVGAELAHLADACLDAAVSFHQRALEARHGAAVYTDDDGVEHPARLSVIGMGKLGGEELNFCSDVDLIFVYSSDNGEVGKLSLHQFFSKLCERVTQTIGEVTDQDLVFRVDLRLRPEGSKGAIANSLPSMERYYESFGRPWERQAWLKARHCAGDAELGAAMIEILRPFVYSRSLSDSVIAEVQDLNRRIKDDLIRPGSVDSGFDVKNGVGGIREVEFFVQAHQLIHAGRRPMLRSRSTIGALDQLLFAGLISEEERKTLARGYRFLRHVEHVLQLDTGRQTQRLPAQADNLERLARRLGYGDAHEFLIALDNHTRAIATLFETLGSGSGAPSSLSVRLAAGDLGEEDELRALSALGFRDPHAARDQLDRARRKPTSPLGPSGWGAAVRCAPVFLDEIAHSPDPDQALRYATQLIGRRGSWSTVWRLMDDNPALMRLVASLFGTSEFLSKNFVSLPGLIDSLLEVGRAAPSEDRSRAAAELDEQLGLVDPEDIEARWSTLSDFKHRQVLRIGLADIGGELEPEDVCRELSAVAELVLQRALDIVYGAMVEQHGTPRADNGDPCQLAVVGLGKLGGRELGYASDLDVIFIYDHHGTSDGRRSLDVVTFMTRVAQRLMSGLHALHPGGRLYELDTRLRPSGSQGLLVSSLAAWHQYHREKARLWERQALTKLRAVAGAPELGAEVERSAAHYVYEEWAGRGDAAEVADAILKMRSKIRSELAARGAYDIKTGRGGLVDIEFAAQYLQIVYGPGHPELRTQSTTAALEAAIRLGVVDAETGALLVDGYRFLRSIEHRVRIVHDRSIHRLPSDPDELEKLAKRAGYPDGSDLRAAVERWFRAIDDAFHRVLARSDQTGA